MTQDIENQTGAPRLPWIRRRSVQITLALAILIFLIWIGLFRLSIRPLAWELGEGTPDTADFLRLGFLPVECESDLAMLGETVGTHAVRFTLFGIPLYAELTVMDVSPPVFTLKPHAILSGDTVEAADFIVSASDASAFTCTLELEGSSDVPGEHTAHLFFTDAYGNTAAADTVLTVYGSANSVTVEAGASPDDVRHAIADLIPEAMIQSDLAALSLDVPGTETVTISAGSLSFSLRVLIEDTTAPIAEVHTAYALLGTLPDPMAYFSAISDRTAVTAAYEVEPDPNVPGDTTAQIRLTDAAGNSALYTAPLTIYAISAAVTIEAGTTQNDALDLILGDTPGVSLAKKYAFSTMSPGESVISVRTPGGTFDVALTIVDTTPPTARGKRVTFYLPATKELTAADFVENITDASEVTASFAHEVDFATPGKRAVTILLTDAAGNTAEITAALTVVDDREAPVISGVRDLYAYVGSGVSYKSGITATDNDGTSVSVSVDSSRVNLSAPGTYPITYSASDAAGNVATAQAVVTVLEITEDVLRPYAQNILSRILSDSMTAWEKAEAIYDWMTANVSYVAYADKTYWMRAAYTGFTTGRGDCYVFYAMSRALLDCAGIENMEICRDNPAKPHYWNLVNCGDGWYHFDTCPHYAKYPLRSFMLTDAQVQEYSENSVADYYSFDASLYPATP